MAGSPAGGRPLNLCISGEEKVAYAVAVKSSLECLSLFISSIPLGDLGIKRPLRGVIYFASSVESILSPLLCQKK